MAEKRESTEQICETRVTHRTGVPEQKTNMVCVLNNEIKEEQMGGSLRALYYKQRQGKN